MFLFYSAKCQRKFLLHFFYVCYIINKTFFLSKQLSFSSFERKKKEVEHKNAGKKERKNQEGEMITYRCVVCWCGAPVV